MRLRQGFPTAALSPSEVERLFSLIDQLRLDGHAIGFVSHRLEEVLTLTDRVTVLRDGHAVAESVPTNTLDQGALVRLMVGRELGSIYSSRPAAVHHTGQIVLEAVHLAALPNVKDVSFTLHAGEILGLGGLVGSGRSETVETIFGLRSQAGGHVILNGKEFVARRPADALKAGIALVPEDRRRQSIIPDFSVAENLMLGHLGVERGIRPAYRAQGARAAELMALLDLPADRLSDPDLLNFSGGMQQKIIIARWLLLSPKVLILDEPTKGIDIATRASIYRMLRKIADQGVAILVISSDFEELLGICERVSVISDGTTIADVPSAFLNEEQLTLLAAPRTSMARTQSFLDSFAAEFSGHSFWGLMDAGRLICLADGLCEANTRRDFRPGAIVDIANPSISLGLSVPRGTLAESGDSKVIILDVRTARGHGNGVVGLVVHGSTPAPSAITVRERVAAAFDRVGD